jgi:hypothetical protein
MMRIACLLSFACLVANGLAQDAGEKPIGNAWSDPRNPIVAKFGGQRLDLWSLKPIVRPSLDARGSAGHPVDQLIARPKYPPLNIALSPDYQGEETNLDRADRRTLARRLGFALNGMAPSLEIVQKFEADSRPDAYERLVEAMLASPAYGEHVGRMWLDVVRYSDSNGFDWDELRPTAWRFRDYVIRSFNQDKPFDRFVLEQLAGDEIAADPPQTLADQDALIATGYLRLGPFDNAAPLFNEEARSRAELEADLGETTASAFLAMTMSCCRCHDHKTDPLSHQDHYRMRAFFAKVKFADDKPLDLADEQARIHEHNSQMQAQIDELQKRLGEKLAPILQKLKDAKITKLSEEDRQLLESSEEKLEAKVKSKREKLIKKTKVSDEEARKAMAEPERIAVGEMDKQIEEREKSKRPFMKGLLIGEDAASEAKTFVYEAGDHRKPLDEVVPGFVSILDPNPAKFAAPDGRKTSGRRTALAQWIGSPQNPLTARVLVNRLWQLAFGEAIVATPNDFGFTGTPPANAELLDYLASELIESGWSVKHVMRIIVTSGAFRQRCDVASEHSPFAPKLRRLSAEQLRDAVLSASGLLLAQSGGPPSWPELPADLLNANPALLDDNEAKTKGWYPSPAENQDVRSIYLIQKRTVKIPYLETFDLPDNSVSCGRRLQSIAAPQALTLLNGELMERASQAMELRVRGEAKGEAELIGRVFEFALQRSPSEQELKACLVYLREQSLKELCRVVLNTNEFGFVD